MKIAPMIAALLLTAPGGTWRPAPGLEGGRYAPTATLLRSGPLGGTSGAMGTRETDTVLVVGGYRSDIEECQRSAQLYESATGRFRPTGSLAVGRNFHTATLLEDGRVLIAGGFHTRLGSLASAELYDPRTGAFTSTGGMLTVPRELYTATRLPDGRVLLVGGFDTHSRRTLASAEIYDPRTGRFTRTPGSMAVSRFGHDALWIPALQKVLIAGGKQHDQYTGREWRALNGAELFDPATGQFTSLPPMRYRRDRPTLSFLTDGRVLIAGGKDDESTERPREAEIFDPARVSGAGGPFVPATSLRQDRFAHHAATFPDGRILLLGGWSDSAGATTPASEIYDPRSGVFELTRDRAGRPAPMAASRLDAGVVYLPAANRVLVVGGQRQDAGTENRPISVDGAELYGGD